MMWIRGCTIVVGIWVMGVGLADAQQSAPPKPTSGEKGNTTAASPAIVPKQTPGAGATAIPKEAELMVLLRSTLLAVNQASLTGNYSVLRDLGTPGFRSKNSADRLMANFQSIRNMDIGAVAVLPANLVREPSIDANGRLRLTGFFPSQPRQVNFDLAFEVVDSRWRLSAMALNFQQSPVASTGSPTQPETPPVPVVEPKVTKEPTAAATKPPTAEKKTSARPASAANASPDVSDDVDKPKKPTAAATKPPASEKKTSTKPASAANTSPDVRDDVHRLETGSAPEPKPKPKPRPKPKESQSPFSPY